jgi:hypothetical protein
VVLSPVVWDYPPWCGYTSLRVAAWPAIHTRPRILESERVTCANSSRTSRTTILRQASRHGYYARIRFELRVTNGPCTDGFRMLSWCPQPLEYGEIRASSLLWGMLHDFSVAGDPRIWFYSYVETTSGLERHKCQKAHISTSHKCQSTTVCMLQNTRARGIPEGLLRWIEAFCSERTATIQVNGKPSKVQSLPQAGLPQGSPLSPILFLFFNADLVQRRIDSYGGAIAFTDDFNAWVTGPTQPGRHRRHYQERLGLGEKERCNIRG